MTIYLFQRDCPRAGEVTLNNTGNYSHESTGYENMTTTKHSIAKPCIFHEIYGIREMLHMHPCLRIHMRLTIGILREITHWYAYVGTSGLLCNFHPRYARFGCLFSLRPKSNWSHDQSLKSVVMWLVRFCKRVLALVTVTPRSWPYWLTIVPSLMHLHVFGTIWCMTCIFDWFHNGDIHE